MVGKGGSQNKLSIYQVQGKHKANWIPLRSLETMALGISLKPQKNVLKCEKNIKIKLIELIIQSL